MYNTAINMKNFSKNIALWLIIGLLLIALFNLFQGTSNNRVSSTISFSDFITAIESGNVSEVQIKGDNVEGFFEDGRPFNTYAPNYPNLVDKLNENGVQITAVPIGKAMHPILSVLLILVSNAFTYWCMDIFYASNAIGWWKSYGFWKI